MLISGMFGGKTCLLSIEIFPPQNEGAVQPALEARNALRTDFIGVTYGAGGGAAGEFTAQTASHIKNKPGIGSLAHLACVPSVRRQAVALRGYEGIRGRLPECVG